MSYNKLVSSREQNKNEKEIRIMKKNITLLAIMTSVITVLSGCSSEHFERAAAVSSDNSTTSKINPQSEIEIPQSSTVEISFTDNGQKETPSEIQSKKEEEVRLPEASKSKKTESDTATLPETNTENISDTGADNSGNITQKPDAESTPEGEAPLKPQTTPEAKPQTVPDTKPQVSPEAKPGGISESDILDFYPDNFNCEELAIGETHKPSASIWLNGGKGKAYSSDEAVATVSNSGVVTAKGKGTAYIKIVGATGMSKIYRYTVNESGITEDDILGFYPDDFNCKELTIGETHKPSASVWLKNGNGKVYSSDEAVVTVNSNGVVTARGEGVAYIKIVSSTGMSEMYMYIVDSDSASQDDFEALFDGFQW